MFESTRSASRAWGVGFVIVAALFAAVTTMPQASAQVPPTVYEPAELVSIGPGAGGLMLDGAIAPSISAIGDIIAFQGGLGVSFGGPDQPMWRNRPAGSTGLVEPILGQNPTISDDGCVIAYSAPQADSWDDELEATYFRELIAYNRCTGTGRLLDEFEASNLYGEIIPAPGVSADGSVIAFGRTTEPDNSSLWRIVVWRNGVQELSLDSPDGTAEINEVSISDDGTVIAFSTRSGSPNFEDKVWLYDTRSPGMTLLSGDGTHPSVSGDGSLIVYHGRDLVVHDRTRGLDRIVANSGFEPSISRDGRYVLYRIEDSGCENALLLLRRTSDRWASSTEPELVTYLRPDIDPNTCHDSYEPVVSAHGRWVAWSSGDAELYVDFPGLTANSPSQVLVRQRRPVVSVASIDFGAASSAVERQATVTNVGPSGWRVTSIAASGGAFSVIGESCPGVLDPGASCSVTVRYSPSGEGQQTGQLVVRDDSYPGIPLSASGRLVGISDPEQPPPGPDPDPDPVVSITITPNPVVFDEVVVGTQAPGRTAIVENVGEIAVPIDSSAISGSAAGDFAVVSDGCSGTMLQIGSTCDLELGFTASDAGASVASLSVSGSTGASASATLEGAGRFDVELSVLPDVTSGGQSVFVSGTGYPASTVVQVTVGGTTADATTDGAGNFTLGLFVLSGVPQGEMAIDDVADPGRYDAEPVELLVVGSPVRPQATSVFSRIGRRHVSR